MAAGEGERVSDPIVEAVRAELAARSAAGIAKYGTTLARTDLSPREWLQHLKEELLDAAGYVQRLIELSGCQQIHTKLEIDHALPERP